MHKTGPFGDAIIELHGDVVGLMGQPLHVHAAGAACLGIYMLDQLSAYSTASHVRVNEQILQIAAVASSQLER